MRTVVTKWVTQCAINQFVNVLDTHGLRQVLAAGHPYKKTQKYEQFHTCFNVKVGKFEK
jgi:hypothetical protein